MKNKIIIIAMFLFISISAKAEDNGSDDIKIGVKGGISYSNIYDATGEEFNADATFGLTAGGFLNIPVGDVFGVQPEAMITQKGFEGNGKLLNQSYTFTRTTTFFEIPIYFTFKANEQVTLLFGPQYSYLLRQRDEFSSSAVSYDQEQEFKKDNINNNIFGLAGGVDIYLDKLIIGGRFAWDVQNNRGDGTSFTPRYKNVCAQLTIGLQL